MDQDSLTKLATIDRKLYDICTEANKVMPFKVIAGFRNQEQQNADFAKGVTKLKWPDGKHNKSPSLAVDLAPDPIDWNDTARFYVLAGIMLAVASSKGIKLRWGGDWNGNFDIKHNSFNDLG